MFNPTPKAGKVAPVEGSIVIYFGRAIPSTRPAKFGVGRFAWDTSVRSIDWGAVFHNHTLEKFKLEGLKPKILEDLITHIDKLDNLKKLEILPDDFYGWVDFPLGFARELLETSCCPMLQEV
ncbi:hypothetical protein FRC08_018919 [Ceratobasidium sp. 394]|nr:hypothetical protein FRC08_018919 [Ceratobasidium sp. 394]KAG9085888.1 hypothetical protein FS749_004041 [Ceratobasidium sp. UAMH 11750]